MRLLDGFSQGAQGAASLAPGYALHWAFSPTLLSWKQARLFGGFCASRWFFNVNGRQWPLMVVNVFFVGYGAQWSLMVLPQRSCGNGR